MHNMVSEIVWATYIKRKFSLFTNRPDPFWSSLRQKLSELFVFKQNLSKDAK
jgi:hypothetical protein